MTLSDFLQRLSGVKGSGGQYMARCPAHDDHEASLSVGVGRNGSIIVNCHAGCSVSAVLESMGLSMSDLHEDTNERPASTIECEYVYLDKQCKEAFKKVKVRQANGKKTFYWMHKVGEKWQKGRPATETCPLYNWHAITPGERTYLVEGEKDVDTLTRAGLLAVSAPDGAKSKWLNSYTENLSGLDVVIIQDNDAPGKAYAQTAAKALYKKAASVKIVDLVKAWPDLPEHGDISDVLKDHGAGALPRLLELERQTKPYNPKATGLQLEIISARELQDADIPPAVFVIRDLLTAGLAMLAAPPKYGKSWMVLDMCLAVAAGLPFLGYKTEAGGCLYLALEDTPRRLKDRMEKVLKGARAPQGFNYSTSAHDVENGLIEELENYVSTNPTTKLIVIDTLQKVRPSQRSNENAYAADYKVMSPMKEFADKHKLCILLVHHLRKMKDTEDPFNQISGTNGIFGALDTSIVLTRSKRSDEETTLSITGRDIDAQDKVVTFDKSDFRWKMKGDSDWWAEQRARAEYDQSAIVLTIKKLLEQNSGSWRGTMTDLNNAGKYIARTALASSTRALTERIKTLESPLFQYDGIAHERTKNGSSGGSCHTFYYAYAQTGDSVEQKTLLSLNVNQRGVRGITGDKKEECIPVTTVSPLSTVATQGSETDVSLNVKQPLVSLITVGNSIGYSGKIDDSNGTNGINDWTVIKEKTPFDEDTMLKGG